MSFQAPFDIMDYARLRMTAEAQQQEQQQKAQQQYMQTITGALGDIANMYQQSEEMKAGVKAGEQFGKMFGKQFGLDPAIFNSPEYKGMGLQAQYQLNKGILGNFGSLSQNFNYGLNAGIRQNAPYVAQDIRNQQNIAGGNVPYGGGVPQSPAGMAPVEPPLPVADENLPPVTGAPMAAPSTSVPGGQASINAINRDRQRRGLPPIK